MAKDKKFIYASHKKFDAKKSTQIDEDLTYSSEEDAIKYFIKGLSGIDKDMEKEFNDGDDIDIYLYQLDKDHVPYLFKKIEIEKDDSDDGYKITDEEEEDLPDDFVPYGDESDDEKENDEDDEEDTESNDESEDNEKDEKEEDSEEDKSDDSSDDVQDLKESVLSLSSEFYGNDGLVTEVANKANAIIKEFGLNDKETLTESMAYLSEGVDQVLNVLSESIPVSNYKDQLALVAIHQYFTEKTLKAKDRKALDESEFGIPSLRKYPIPDKAHVKAAIQRFNYVDSKHEKELADNIIKAMKKFNMMYDIEVGEKNRFKKYLDNSYKEFKESYDIYPFPLELTKEFSVGAMLPMMGSTEGWGTKLANTPIEDVVASNNQDMEKYATLYDTSELENDAIEYRKKLYTGTSLDDGIISREETLCESVIPHRNLIFDKEVEDLVKKLKDFISNPKNDFMEDILKKSLNFKKNIYTIKLNDQDGKDSNKVISKIKSCGFRDVDDQGVKVLYEKEVKGLLLTLIYDTVGDKIRVTYEPYDKDKELKESTDDLMIESIFSDIIDRHSFNVGKKINALTQKKQSFIINNSLSEKIRTKPVNIDYGRLEDVIYKLRKSIQIVKRERPELLKIKIIETFNIDDLTNFYTAADFYSYIGNLSDAPAKLTIVELLHENERGIKWLKNDYTKEMTQLCKRYEEIKNKNDDPKLVDEADKIYQRINGLFLGRICIESIISANDGLGEDFVKIMRKTMRLPVDTVQKIYMKDGTFKESVSIFEASKDEIDEDIRALVDKLNRKGYKTKYSCSGHTKARIKEDGYRNGIYKGKLYTTARIVFDDDYKLNPPKGWKVKTFDGKIGIYPIAPDYEYKNGVPDDAFDKWKNEYMAELKMWVNGLPDKPGPTEESVDELLDNFSDILFEESIIDSAKNTLRKPKIMPSTDYSNQLNLTFKGIKLTVNKKRSDEDSEMFLKRVKRDLSWLNKVYDKAVNKAIKEDLLEMAENWEMPCSASKIKSLMKLDYVQYNPGPGDNECTFTVAFNTSANHINDKFFYGHSYWIEIGLSDGKPVSIEYSMEG